MRKTCFILLGFTVIARPTQGHSDGPLLSPSFDKAVTLLQAAAVSPFWITLDRSHRMRATKDSRLVYRSSHGNRIGRSGSALVNSALPSVRSNFEAIQEREKEGFVTNTREGAALGLSTEYR
jgi:hypothetical protein